MKDAAIHRISRDAVDLSLRFLAPSRSPRAFSPRDDKSEDALAMTRVNETVIQDANLRTGSACLAWPFWATAHLVQARPAPPSAMSVILPYIALSLREGFP